MSMCLTRSCKVGSSERLIAALLSQQIVVGAVGVWLILLRSVRSQIHSFEASNAAVYSASQDEAATVFCFLACHETTPEPREYA